jgi:glycosidase
VYYGDEVGMEGGEDPDNRRCMLWDQTHWEHHILHAYRTLIHARRDRPWLAWGEFTDLVTDDRRHIYAYRRAARGTLETVYGRSDDELVVVLNTGKNPSDVSIPVDGTWRDLLTEQRYTSAAGSGALSLRIKAGDAFALVRA